MNAALMLPAPSAPFAPFVPSVETSAPVETKTRKARTPSAPDAAKLALKVQARVVASAWKLCQQATEGTEIDPIALLENVVKGMSGAAKTIIRANHRPE